MSQLLPLFALLFAAPGFAVGEADGTDEEAPHFGEEIVVEGTRSVAKDATRDATSVEGEQLRESTRASTFEAVAQETADVFVPARGPGLHGVGNGATGAIHIRGLGGSPNSQILVMEDGVPDYQGIFGHPIADAYIPTLIDNLAVVKGGDSVLYGTNALGGALIIRSRWREANGFEVQSDVSAGSYSTLRTSIAALGRAGSWDAAAGFFGLDTEGHREGAGGTEEIGVIAARYRPGPSLTITVREKLAHLIGNDPGPISNPTPDNWYDVWRDTTSLQLAWGQGGTRVTVTPYVNIGTHRLYDGFYSRDYVGGTIAEGEQRFGSTLRLLLGLAAEGVGGEVRNRITGDAPDVPSTWSASAYAQVTWRPLPTVTAVLGGRELASTRWGSIPLYKAGLRWDLLPELFFRAGIAANFRQPTLRELYLPYPTANPDLRPERATNASVGLGYESEHLSIAATGYRTHATNLIKYFGVFPAADVVNIDELTIWGAEGRVAVRHIGPLAAYVAGDTQAVGRFTRQNPSTRVTFGVEVSQGDAEGVAASLDGEWVHGLYMSDYGRDPIPDVFVVDAAVRWRHVLAARGVTIEPYLVVRNVFDRQYAYVAGYVMPGLNVMVGLKLGV